MADFIDVGTAPTGADGDTVREANTKINGLVAQTLADPGIVEQSGGALQKVTPADPGDFNNWDTLGDVIDGLVSLGLFTPPVPPDVPAGLALVGGNNAITVSWDAASGAATYDVQSSPDDITWTTISTAQSGLTYIDTGAPATAALSTTGYVYYRVRSISAFGVESDYCASDSASPWLVYDLCTGTNGTLLPAHTPNINQSGTVYVSPSTGAVLDGDLQITGNKIATHSTATSGTWSATKDVAQKDVRVKASIQPVTSIRLRYVNSQNYFLASIITGPGRLVLYEVNAGVSTIRASQAMTVDTAAFYEVDFSVLGTALTLETTGVAPVTYTISGSYSGSLTSTIIGFGINSALLLIDTIRIATTAPLPGLSMWLRGVSGFTAATWTDQGLNGNDPTQATSGNQLSLATAILGGQDVVRSPDAARIMNAGSIQPTSASFCKVALFKCADLTEANNLISGSNANGAHAFRLAGGQFPRSDIYSAGSPVAQLTSSVGVGSPQTDWALVILNAWYSNPAASGHVSPATLQESVYVNSVGGAYTKFPATTMVSSSTLSVAGLQGSTSAGFQGDIAELLLTASTTGPTAADVNRLIAKVNTTYTLSYPYFERQILYIGDSITAGYTATSSGSSWAGLIEAAQPTYWHVNKGQASVGAMDLQGESIQFYPFVACGVETFVTVFAGTNDIAIYSQTGAQTYTAIQNFCLALKAATPCTIVVVGMLPRGPSVEAQRVILNNLLLAGWTGFADGYADVTTIPMGQPGANTDLTYYNADGTHPNNTGHADLYALNYGVMEPLL